jgi:hypothetical protein
VLAFLRSAGRFGGALLRRILTMFHRRGSEPLTADLAGQNLEAPAAIAMPQVHSGNALIMRSAEGLKHHEPGGMDNAAETFEAPIIWPLGIAASDLQDMASVEATSADAKPIDAAGEQPQASTGTSHDLPWEKLAQAAEAETGGWGNGPGTEFGALTSPQLLTEPGRLISTVDAHPPPAEPASIEVTENIERAEVAPPAANLIASPQAAYTARMDVTPAPLLPSSETKKLSPHAADAKHGDTVNNPDEDQAIQPALCGDLWDESEKGGISIPLIAPCQPVAGDAEALAVTQTEAAGEPREADGLPGERADNAAPAADATRDGDVPAVEASSIEVDASDFLDAEKDSDVDDLASAEPEQPAAGDGIAPGENEAGQEPGPRRPPTYRPRLERSRTRREQASRAAAPEREYQDLEADLQILFGPTDWGIELCALLRRPADAEEIAVLEGGDETWLGALDDRLLEPLALADGARVLSAGLSINAVGLPVRWRRSSRDIHVFGENASVAGFVSQPRVAIGRENVVICKDELAGAALAQIAATGANAPSRIEGPGVPSGWFCWRGIRPARPSAPQDGPAILHALDPLPAASIELAGGLQLACGRWLEGHPPSIRLLGSMEPGEPVRIDGRHASLDSNGTWTAEGWDRRGDHRIEYGGLTATYEVERGASNWDWWPAWGETTAVAGALATANGREYFHTDPFAHLLGAVPGEICGFSAAIGGIYVARPEFTPVWLLARVAGTRGSKPSLIGMPLAPSERAGPGVSAIIEWARTISSVGHIGAPGSAERRLWGQYLAVAKRKRRPPR